MMMVRYRTKVTALHQRTNSCRAGWNSACLVPFWVQRVRRTVNRRFHCEIEVKLCTAQNNQEYNR